MSASAVAGDIGWQDAELASASLPDRRLGRCCPLSARTGGPFGSDPMRVGMWRGHGAWDGPCEMYRGRGGHGARCRGGVQSRRWNCRGWRGR